MMLLSWKQGSEGYYIYLFFIIITSTSLSFAKDPKNESYMTSLHIF